MQVDLELSEVREGRVRWRVPGSLVWALEVAGLRLVDLAFSLGFPSPTSFLEFVFLRRRRQLICLGYRES